MWTTKSTPPTLPSLRIPALLLALAVALSAPAASVAAGAARGCGDFRAAITDCADVSPQADTFPIVDDLQRSVSGRMLSLTVSTDGTRLYVGSFSGVWRSDDAGATWHQLTRPQPVSGNPDVPGALTVPTVSDVVVSPTDRDTVLAATGSDTRRLSASRNGIYHSDTAGDSWRLVHQFKCPPTFNPGPVGQIVFAPDDPSLLYAAGGCAIAVSRDGGRTWLNNLLPPGGTVWHVAVAAREPTGLRRVYAAGDDKMWYSENAGSTWARDTNPDLPPSFGGSPFGGSNSAQILAVEPDRPHNVYLAVPALANGPSYYHAGPRADGVNCNGVKFVDQNGDGQWTPGETVAAEARNLNNFVYNLGESIILGAAPLTGTRLSIDGNLRSIDQNGNGLWDQGETLVYDSNGDRKYNPGEPVILGTPPALNTSLPDPRECGEGSLWAGTIPPSCLVARHAGSSYPGPLYNFGASTPSGRVYVLATIPTTTPPGYLLFLGDTSHVHVSAGRPVAHFLASAGRARRVSEQVRE